MIERSSRPRRMMAWIGLLRVRVGQRVEPEVLQVDRAAGVVARLGLAPGLGGATRPRQVVLACAVVKTAGPRAGIAANGLAPQVMWRCWMAKRRRIGVSPRCHRHRRGCSRRRDHPARCRRCAPPAAPDPSAPKPGRLGHRPVLDGVQEDEIASRGTAPRRSGRLRRGIPAEEDDVRPVGLAQREGDPVEARSPNAWLRLQSGFIPGARLQPTVETARGRR